LKRPEAQRAVVLRRCKVLLVRIVSPHADGCLGVDADHREDHVYDDATMEMAINAKKKALARWSRGSASSLYMLNKRRPPFNINAETTAYGPSPSNRIFTR
jgi:hypothetical protein